MADQKRVDFVAGGNLTQYMQTVRDEAKRIARESLQAAQTQSSSLKEQVSLIKQALELEQKRRAEASRKVLNEDRAEIDRLKQELGGSHNKRKIINQIDEREQAYSQNKKYFEEEDSAVAKLLKEMSESLKKGFADEIKSNNELFSEILNENKEEAAAKKFEEHRTEPKEEEGHDKRKGNGGGGFFTDLLLYDLFKSLLSEARGVSRTNDGFDQVANAGGGLSRLLGTIVGGLVGGARGAIVGGEIVGQIGGGVTEQYVRAYEDQQALQRATFAYRALTGRANSPGGGKDAQSLGLSSTDALTLNTQIAQRYGRANGQLNAVDVTALQKALGVSTDSTLQLVDVQRMGTDVNKDAFSTITGLLKVGEKGGLFPGGDRTFLNEFIGQFASVSRMLGAVQTKMDDPLVARTLLGFNAVGGQFSLRDPRSLGNISTINNALSNPQDDIHRAINLRILRQANPNATLDQLLEEQTKGVFSKSLLRGTLQTYGNAPQGTALTAIRNALGGNLSYDAVRELYNNRDKILSGKIDPNDLINGGLKRGQVIGQGSEFTAQADKFRAEITDAYVQGARAGITEAIDKLTKAIQAVFERSSVTVKVDANGRAVIENTPRTKAQVNPTFTPTQLRHNADSLRNRYDSLQKHDAWEYLKEAWTPNF